MKDMKNSLKESIARGFMNLGEAGVSTYSIFINWYEPKISLELLKNKGEKNK